MHPCTSDAGGATPRRGVERSAIARTQKLAQCRSNCRGSQSRKQCLEPVVENTNNTEIKYLYCHIIDWVCPYGPWLYRVFTKIRCALVGCSLFTQCLIANAVGAGEISGPAHVIDGDSLRIKNLEIRLHGIDAPESRQTCTIGDQQWACGRSATQALGEILVDATVRCTWTERDRYGRALATCFANGTNINAKLVTNGFALAYRQYSGRYIANETLARGNARGLWRSRFIAPWRWRRTNAAHSKRR